MAGKRVLIVAEAGEVGRMLRAALESLGAGLLVRVVSSAEEALQDPMHGQAQLLVMDTRLPGISGFELLAKIRQPNPRVRAILLARQEEDTPLNHARMGLDDRLLVKPVRTAVFLDAVREVLEISRLSGSQDLSLRPSPPPVQPAAKAAPPQAADKIEAAPPESHQPGIKPAAPPPAAADKETQAENEALLARLDAALQKSAVETPPPPPETAFVAEKLPQAAEKLPQAAEKLPQAEPVPAQPPEQPASPKTSVERPAETPAQGQAKRGTAVMPPGVMELLDGLCQRLGAGAALILDMAGNTLAQAGSLPGWDGQAALFPEVLAAVTAAGRAAQKLQSGTPQGVLALYGTQVNLAAAPAAGKVLIMLTPADGNRLRAALAFEEVLLGSRALEELLAPSQTEAQQPEDLGSLLSRSQPAVDDEQLAAFWEAALAEHPSPPGGADTLSYEQATRLNLAPEDDSGS